MAPQYPPPVHEYSPSLSTSPLPNPNPDLLIPQVLAPCWPHSQQTHSGAIHPNLPPGPKAHSPHHLLLPCSGRASPCPAFPLLLLPHAPRLSRGGVCVPGKTQTSRFPALPESSSLAELMPNSGPSHCPLPGTRIHQTDAQLAPSDHRSSLSSCVPSEWSSLVTTGECPPPKSSLPPLPASFHHHLTKGTDSFVHSLLSLPDWQLPEGRDLCLFCSPWSSQHLGQCKCSIRN